MGCAVAADRLAASGIEHGAHPFWKMSGNPRSESFADQLQPPRFVVGIDLGTTNSAVCFVDTQRLPWRVATMAIPQVVAPGVVERRETLPSCHYQPAAGELAGDALRLPWDAAPRDHAVGLFARDHGALTPGRLVASAKSWLCHSGVDRTAELLPWHGAEDAPRFSPVQISARILRHVREAWDHEHPGYPLAEQDVVLTLPASFDEVARELTVAAAREAGLPRVVLIEEPQAAFYAWIDAHRDDWHRRVAAGQKILVCDIGGGTSDFTLIRVRAGRDGAVHFHRVAVGEHLILGGDNLDLALAHQLESRLQKDGRLPPRQWDVLVRTCRQVKETLLGEGAPERLTVNLPSTGARLIGGGMQIELTRDEVHRWLVDGFFPRCRLDERPQRRQSGFQEFGLPFAPDPAVTRYLAAFLTTHRFAGEDADAASTTRDHDPARPDVVLFNGAVFSAPAIRRRLLEVIADWFGDGDWQPTVLANDRLDLAVAHGAAYYGMVRRGEGVRIAAGLARSYYVVAESDAAKPLCVCVAPGSAEPGQDIETAGRQFELLVAQPVEFPLMVSSTRLTDRPGDAIELDPEQMRPLAPIRTVLRTRSRKERAAATVTLHARLTEIGTLELWCREAAGERTWRLQFDVRSATQTDVDVRETSGERQGVIDEGQWLACQRVLETTFGPAAREKPSTVVRRLADALECSRQQWPMPVLRRIWETLMTLESGRQQSAAHEARWLNLVGFCLRPGYGVALDDWRVAETWRTTYGRLVHPAAACRAEVWILWRRIAGGLGKGQQQTLAGPLIAALRNLHHQLTTGRGRGADLDFSSQEGAEVLRMLGALELLDLPTKAELGSLLIDLLPKRKMQPARAAIVWTLGRLAARVPVFGPLNAVLPAEIVARWLPKMLEHFTGDPQEHFAVMQLARRTDDRYRDLERSARERAIGFLERHDAAPHLVELVARGGSLATEEQDQVFGESLPRGLRIR